MPDASEREALRGFRFSEDMATVALCTLQLARLPRRPGQEPSRRSGGKGVAFTPLAAGEDGVAFIFLPKSFVPLVPGTVTRQTYQVTYPQLLVLLTAFITPRF